MISDIVLEKMQAKGLGIVANAVNHAVTAVEKPDLGE